MPNVHSSEESSPLVNEERREKFISAHSAEWRREQSNKQLGDSLVSYGDESLVSFPGGETATPVSEESQSNESKPNIASIVKLKLTIARFGSLFKTKLTGNDHGSFHKERQLRVSRFIRISMNGGNVDCEEESNDVLEKIKNYPPLLQNLIRVLNLMTAASAALFLWRDPENRIQEYVYFSVNGVKSPWPGTITMTIDYSWFFLMTIMPFMLPKDNVLIRKHELGYRPKEI